MSGTLNQELSAERTLYTARVPNNVNGIKATPTAADSGTMIKVNGQSVASGSQSGDISFPPRDKFSILFSGEG